MVGAVRWSEGRTGAVSDSRARNFLVDHGLPEDSLLFEADREGAGVFTTDAGQEVLRIGSFDEDFRFFVDIRSGEVLFGLEQDPAPSFANASLAVFVECLRWIDRELPCYSLEDDSAVKAAAGERVLGFLRSVDPEAVGAADGFWTSFAQDVGIGDYHEGAL